MSARPVRVVHVITRLIVGGAQENTILSCALIDRARFPSDILVGPQTGSEGELFGEARERGVPVHLEPSLVRQVSPLHDVASVGKLVGWFRKLRPDVVHTHSSKAGIVGRVAARIARVPSVVHTVHGWGFHDQQSKKERVLYQTLERACAPLCDALVVVAEKNRTLGLELGIGRPEQYRVIRSGLELDAYRRDPAAGAELRTQLGFTPGDFVFGTVGRLSDQKAPLDALEAFARVAARHPEARFVFVGDGPLRDRLEREVAAKSLGGAVRFTGLRRDVREFLSSFDAFVLSSRWEGLPRVVPQAMAAGLPVVATAVDGTPEAIAPGVSGELVSPGDVAALAERMAELAAEPARARAMGERGRERVEPFSARAMVDELAGLYAALAGRRSRA
jgi:glycosyltransferase involved in cell wall biosynthesis